MVLLEKPVLRRERGLQQHCCHTVRSYTRARCAMETAQGDLYAIVAVKARRDQDVASQISYC